MIKKPERRGDRTGCEGFFVLNSQLRLKIQFETAIILDNMKK